MATELASLVVSLEANIAKFQSDMGRAAYLTQKALADMQRAAEKLDDRIGDLGRNIIGFAAVYVSVDQLTSSFRNALNEMDAMVKMGQKFGVATDSLQELAYAGKLSDVEIDKLGQGLKALSVNIAEATAGSKSQVAAFRALGVEFKNADGSARSVDAVLNDVADRFAATEDGVEKTAWSVELFKKAGQDLIPLLNGGSAGLATMADEARRFGLVVENDVLVSAERFNDNITRLTSVIRGGFNVAVETALPTMNDFAEAFINVANESKKLFTGTEGSDWVDVLAMGLARLVDVIGKIAQGMKALSGSFRVVAKDIEIWATAVGESLPSQTYDAIKSGKGVFFETKKLRREKKDLVESVNNDYDRFLNEPGNAMEQAMAARIAERQRKQAGVTGIPQDPDIGTKKKGQLPAPPKAGTDLETAADKERRRLLKAMVDGRVAELEAGLTRERDAYAAHDQLLAALRQQELISATVFEDARAATRESTLAATVRTYDAEIAELQKLKTAKGIEQSEIADIDNKIAAVAARREKAVNDAAAAQQQAVARGSVQAAINVQLREYAAELNRTNDALVFQATLTARNAAEVARLVAEYQVLAQVEEDIRRARLAAPDEVDELGMRIEGLQRAKLAGQAAEYAANESAARALAFQMNEYAISVQRATEFENARLDLTGKTAQEAEKALNAKRIEFNIEEQIRRAQQQSSAPIDRQPYDERSRQLIENSNAATDRRYAQLRDPWLGAQAAVVAYGEEASKVGEQVGNVFMTAFRGMEDAFVEFVKTGKLSFRDLADSIIVEIIRIQARQAAANIGNWLFNVGASMFGGLKPQAAGGVWDDGIQRFAAGGIVERPTLFGMKGGTGLMGEAGPEAILPLKRGANGKLGVVAAVGAQASPSVTISNTYHIDARSDRAQIIQMIEQGSRVTQSTIQSQISRGSTAYTRPR